MLNLVIPPELKVQKCDQNLLSLLSLTTISKLKLHQYISDSHTLGDNKQIKRVLKSTEYITGCNMEMENDQPGRESLQGRINNYLHDSPSEMRQSGKKLVAIIVSTDSIPLGRRVRWFYNLFLIIFYMINLVYTSVMFVIKRQHAAYNGVYITISAIGILLKLVIAPHLRNCIIYCRHTAEQRSPNERTSLLSHTKEGYGTVQTGCTTEGQTDRTAEEQTNTQTDRTTEGQTNTQNDLIEHSKKRDTCITVTDYIFFVAGEVLIYLSMIYSLYGFIDERGWKFNRAFAELDFALLMYNIATDMIYAKMVLIVGLVKALILIDHEQHQNREQNTTYDKYENGSKYAFTPHFLQQ